MTTKTQTTGNWREIRQKSAADLTEDIVAFIELCSREANPGSQLIAVLHKVQDHYGHLGEAQLNAVAQLLRVPHSKVTGVASFYHFFRLQPRGKFVIRICMGTACYVKGARKVVDKFQEELGIDFGETTKDGLFSLESSRCLGTCGLAPVIMIENEVHGPIAPEDVPSLIEKLMQQART